jgi:hypothetical protein
MNNKEVYQSGIDAFLEEKWRNPLSAISNFWLPLNAEQRFIFAKGFNWAKDYFN